MKNKVDDFEEPTAFESMVLGKLHERVKRITKGKPVTRDVIGSIVVSCSSWNFPIIFGDENPKDIVEALSELIRKGFVKEFSDKGFPSYIPITYTKFQTTSYQEFTQADI